MLILDKIMVDWGVGGRRRERETKDVDGPWRSSSEAYLFVLAWTTLRSGPLSTVSDSAHHNCTTIALFRSPQSHNL